MRKLRPVLVLKVIRMRLVVLAPGQYFSVSITFWVFGEVGWPFIGLMWVDRLYPPSPVNSWPYWVAYQGFSFFTHSLDVSQELPRPGSWETWQGCCSRLCWGGHSLCFYCYFFVMIITHSVDWVTQHEAPASTALRLSMSYCPSQQEARPTHERWIIP